MMMMLLLLHTGCTYSHTVFCNKKYHPHGPGCCARLCCYTGPYSIYAGQATLMGHPAEPCRAWLLCNRFPFENRSLLWNRAFDLWPTVRQESGER
jgi:hypothetical protein